LNLRYLYLFAPEELSLHGKMEDACRLPLH